MQTGPLVPGPHPPTTRPRQREGDGEASGIGVVGHHEDMLGVLHIDRVLGVLHRVLGIGVVGHHEDMCLAARS